jgi:hypothetical protein
MTRSTMIALTVLGTSVIGCATTLARNGEVATTPCEIARSDAQSRALGAPQSTRILAGEVATAVSYATGAGYAAAQAQAQRHRAYAQRLDHETRQLRFGIPEGSTRAATLCRYGVQ